MRRSFRLVLRDLVGLCLLMVACGAAWSVEPAWVERWNRDLDEVGKILRELHPDPFGRLSREDFDQSIADLRDRLPSLEHHEIVVELMKRVAALQDGHTRIPLTVTPPSGLLRQSPPDAPELEALRFSDFPIRFALVQGELFVDQVASSHEPLLGGRVVRFGQLSPAEAIARVSPAVHRDNEQQLLELLPGHLVVAEVLHACGVTATRGRLPLVVETPAGEVIEATLMPAADGVRDGWLEARRHPQRMPTRPAAAHADYWFAPVDDSDVVYFRFRKVGSPEGESLVTFASRLDRYLREHPDRTLVIDLRENFSGWHDISHPLLRVLSRNAEINQVGRLFVLIDRTVFAAGMKFAVDIERQTAALFVGEPTGSSPNHFGDSTRRRLPETGLTLRVSTVYWQYSDPRDERPAIEPHVPVDGSFEAWRQGRDPAFETALQLATAGGPPEGSSNRLAGSWSGRVAPPMQSLALSLELGQVSTASIPGIGLEEIPLERSDSGSGVLRGRLPVGREAPRHLTLEGERRGRYLVGLATLETELGPHVFPFAVERRDGTE